MHSLGERVAAHCGRTGRTGIVGGGASGERAQPAMPRGMTEDLSHCLNVKNNPFRFEDGDDSAGQIRRKGPQGPAPLGHASVA